MLQQLQQLQQWPGQYLFKFIIPADEQVYRELTVHFPAAEKTEKKASRKGNYWAISIYERFDSPADVVNRYRKVENIKGLISL